MMVGLCKRVHEAPAGNESLPRLRFYSEDGISPFVKVTFMSIDTEEIQARTNSILQLDA